MRFKNADSVAVMIDTMGDVVELESCANEVRGMESTLDARRRITMMPTPPRNDFIPVSMTHYPPPKLFKWG